jgi:hypothetical protein
MPPPAQCTIQASRMMARTIRTSHTKNHTIPGMAYPLMVLVLATTASYPPMPDLIGRRTEGCGKGGPAVSRARIEGASPVLRASVRPPSRLRAKSGPLLTLSSRRSRMRSCHGPLCRPFDQSDLAGRDPGRAVAEGAARLDQLPFIDAGHGPDVDQAAGVVHLREEPSISQPAEAVSTSSCDAPPARAEAQQHDRAAGNPGTTPHDRDDRGYCAARRAAAGAATAR